MFLSAYLFASSSLGLLSWVATTISLVRVDGGWVGTGVAGTVRVIDERRANSNPTRKK